MRRTSSLILLAGTLVAFGCAPSSNQPTTAEKLSVIQKRLVVVRSDPQQAAKVFTALRQSFENDKENWQETSCYAIAVFECPVEAAVEYVSFVCFLVDNEVDGAANNLTALRVTLNPHAGDGDGEELLKYLTEHKQRESYESYWAAIQTKVVLVKPSRVYEFIFVLRESFSPPD